MSDSYWDGRDSFWDWWRELPDNCFCKYNSAGAVQAMAQKEYDEARSRQRLEDLEAEMARLKRSAEKAGNMRPSGDMTLDEFARRNKFNIEPFNEPWMMLSQVMTMGLYALENAGTVENGVLTADIPMKCILVPDSYAAKRREWHRNGTLGSGYIYRRSIVEFDRHSPQLRFDRGLLILEDERAFSPWGMHENHHATLKCCVIKPPDVKLSRREPGYDGGTSARRSCANRLEG